MARVSIHPDREDGRESLRLVRLELARSPGFPDGSNRHGYEFVAPLDGNRYIDLAHWRRLSNQCTVHRFWGQEDQYGWLVHKPGGDEHAFWAFDYDEASSDDDEPGYRFGAHAFVPGEYVTVLGHDREQHTFRIVSVAPLQ
jgi:hypothetical protein